MNEGSNAAVDAEAAGAAAGALSTTSSSLSPPPTSSLSSTTTTAAAAAAADDQGDPRPPSSSTSTSHSSSGSSSSSTDSDGEEDEGWAPVVGADEEDERRNEDADGLDASSRQRRRDASLAASVHELLAGSIDSGSGALPQAAVLSCRVLRMELPVTSASFLGIEKEELVVTCQLLAGDGDGGDDDEAHLLLLDSSDRVLSTPVASPSGSPTASPLSSPRFYSHSQSRNSSGNSSSRVASTRLPSSYRPSKGEVCWDQRLDIASLRLERLLAPDVGPVRLRLMLWGSAASTLLGRVEVPVLVPAAAASKPGADDDDSGDEEGASPPLLHLGLQRVPIPFFHQQQTQPQPSPSSRAGRTTPLGRRGSAVEPSSSSSQAASSSRKRQLPPRWGRAASEPNRDEAGGGRGLAHLQLGEGDDDDINDPHGAWSPRPFAWPAQGQLVVDVALLAVGPQGSDERKEEEVVDQEAEGEGAGTGADPMSLARALLGRPLDLLGREEAAVLWAQRRELAPDGAALVKLLRSVLAYGPWEEGVGGAALVEAWAAGGCTLTMLDAMKLLGRHFAAEPGVRVFALDQLRRMGDEEIELYLLQLVQLLRYEPWAGGGGGSSSTGSEAATALGAAATMNLPPLAWFLIDRACGSLDLANALFWFLAAEMQTDKAMGRTFEAVRFAFLYTLRERNEPAYAALSAQESWLKRIFKVYQRVLDAPGLRERKQTLLREQLTEEGLARPPLPSIPMPLDPSLHATGLDPATAAVYGSKTYPAFLSFVLAAAASGQCAAAPGATPALEATEEVDEQQQEQQQPPPPPPLGPPTTKVLIFKMREDLRQDQLVLQLLRVMDGLLKARGLDLRLTPYRALATGHQEGIVEHVPGAVTIAEIMASPPPPRSTSTGGSGIGGTGSGGSTPSSRILAFLQQHHPSADDPLGVAPAVVDTYVRSLAGYCVITHLLGIGDRHLHNIMLCPDGRLLHIDFGFILGRDPKQPVPRGPFRLSPAMVDGMGGREHPNFATFKRLCVEAFKCLRGHARLLLGLLDLMVDANLKDLCPNPTTAAIASTGVATTSSGSSIAGGGVLERNNASTTGSSVGLLQQQSSSSQSQPQPSLLQLQQQQQQQAPDAARALARMVQRFRLDLGEDEEALERHFVGLIHKALGALGPQVVEVLHNLAVIAK